MQLEMVRIYRLPSGHKEKVKAIKAVIKDYIKDINSKTLDQDTQLALLRKKLALSSYDLYDYADYTFRLSFDFGGISSEIYRDRKTGKLHLSDKCVVFIDRNTLEYLDNYKW